MNADIYNRTRIFIDFVIKNSCGIKKNDNVYLEMIDMPIEIVSLIIERLYEIQAQPFLSLKSDKLNRKIGIDAKSHYFKTLSDNELYTLKKMDAFIGIKAINNSFELNDIPYKNLEKFRNDYLKPVHHEFRNNYLRWVYLRWPTEAMAQRACMSTETFFQYYLDACNFNFTILKKEISLLEDLFSKAKNVRIVGPGENSISFSKENIPVYVSTGKINLPDGEIFTSPVKESVNGTLDVNITSLYHGHEFRKIKLFFCKGKVVKAFSENNQKVLEKILETDDGSSYIGEFAMGINPLIKSPINEILFDEKINTSFHFALGNAYSVADNGNRSSIHWDLIVDQSEKHGGGKLFFDEVLIKENGKFIYPGLNKLNK